MASTNYYFPHVNVSTRARIRSISQTTEEIFPVLFAPFISDRGPDKELIEITDLSDFTSLFGYPKEFNYEASDTLTDEGNRQKLYACRWLSEGGRVYAYKISDKEGKFSGSVNFKVADGTYSKASVTFTVTGDYYTISGGVSTKATSFNKASRYYTFTEATGDFDSTVDYYTLASGVYTKAELDDDFVEGTTYYTAVVVNNSILFNQLTEDTYYTKDGEVYTVAEAFESGITYYYDVENFDYYELKAVSKYQGTFYQDLLVKARFANTKETTAEGILGKATYYLFKASERLVQFSGYSTENDFVTIELNKLKSYTPKGTEKNLKDVSQLSIILNKGVTVDVDEQVSNDYKSILEDLYTIDPSDSSHILANQLAVPIDCIFLGYETLKAIGGTVNIFEERSDIVFYIDGVPENVTLDGPTDFAGCSDEYNEGDQSNTAALCNIIAFSDQTIGDEEIYTETDIKARANYFLSRMIPYNDNHFSFQQAIAGEERGKIQGVSSKNLSMNPTSSGKQAFYDNKVNYFEADARNVYIMSQLTCAYGDYYNRTALSFANNERTRNRIERKLREIGRRYLFEFNDSITLGNLEADCTKYLNSLNIIKTFDLSVSADENISENVNIDLNILFKGTIEMININITI